MNNSDTHGKRRWFQISLRGLLLWMTILIIGPGGWIVWEQKIARREKAALGKLRQVHAEVYSASRWPASIILGEEAECAVAIGLRNRVGLKDPEKLAPLADLRNLIWIDLQSTELGDDGLAHLSRLEHLARLRIDDTLVTDAGLKHLAGLKSLEVLNLSGTQIGDDGLVHLANLRNLRELDLSGTEVTDAGLKHLENLTQLESVNIRGTRATPTALSALHKKL